MEWTIPICLVGLVLSGNNPAFEISSSAFRTGGRIPAKYCEDRGVSPPLSWSGAPPGAKYLALICDDPDAPRGTFVHWVVFNIPAGRKTLEENFPGTNPPLPEGLIQGRNSAGTSGYIPPAPPPGKPHRYFFKLYALNEKLPLGPNAGKADVEKAMQGHILAEARIFGYYQR